ncbi:MAG TPA: plasmid pRiA4b ORF-3 family protein [Aldersonia sp.]
MSRFRKPKNRRPAPRDAGPFDVVDAPPTCDCPSCSGGDVDLTTLIDSLTQVGAKLATAEDPMDAEVAGAKILAAGSRIASEVEEVLVATVIPELEERGTADALAVLLAIASVADGRAAKSAAAAAERLGESGVPAPRWARDLSHALTSRDYCQFVAPVGTASMLVCTFSRRGRSHAVVVYVNELDCGAAEKILLVDGDDMPAAMEAIRVETSVDGVHITSETLDPAEFRWRVENALEARLVHDRQDGKLAPTVDEPGGYEAMEVLLRARIRTLPESGKPPAPHRLADAARLSALDSLRELLGTDPARTGAPKPRRGRSKAPKLPRKRRKSDGAAPVYQIKVELSGLEPPIWRRLEVPGDITLARLHAVIQVAFDWDDCHLHAFKTEYGEFGLADPDYERRSENPVTLEQVARGAGATIRYTYDFGDDWDHDITVEQVLDRDRAARYPRCTGGDRAAPPEDCGGVGGYAELTEALADPDHPEHDGLLEWLGFDYADEFDPDDFDADAVNETLRIVC